jgi:hypothetical protein
MLKTNTIIKITRKKTNENALDVPVRILRGTTISNGK